jgi:hypothetical protein
MFMLKMDVRGIWWEGVEWNEPDQNRDSWLALVNTVMNFWLHKNMKFY